MTNAAPDRQSGPAFLGHLARRLLDHLRDTLSEPDLALAEAPVTMGLDASSFGENLAARFARITGVGAALPAAP